jgi:hypothetical protein
MKAQNKCEQGPRRSYQSDVANKESTEQLLGRASHCSLIGSDLKTHNFNQHGINICFLHYC